MRPLSARSSTRTRPLPSSFTASSLLPTTSDRRSPSRRQPRQLAPPESSPDQQQEEPRSVVGTDQPSQAGPLPAASSALTTAASPAAPERVSIFAFVTPGGGAAAATVARPTTPMTDSSWRMAGSLLVQDLEQERGRFLGVHVREV